MLRRCSGHYWVLFPSSLPVEGNAQVEGRSVGVREFGEAFALMRFGLCSFQVGPGMFAVPVLPCGFAHCRRGVGFAVHRTQVPDDSRRCCFRLNAHVGTPLRPSAGRRHAMSISVVAAMGCVQCIRPPGNVPGGRQFGQALRAPVNRQFPSECPQAAPPMVSTVGCDACIASLTGSGEPTGDNVQASPRLLIRLWFSGKAAF